MENIMFDDVLDHPECTVSLEEAGLEEPSEQPLFGLMGAESTRHSIYSYVEWFYDGDSSAFSIL
jgi:hypothetical protein